MQTIKYIGSKEQGHTTFTKLTGIVWFPGDEDEVKEEHAKVLLRHPDAFELVPEKNAGKTKPQDPGAAGATLTPGTQVGEANVTPPAPAKPARKAAAKKAAKKAAPAKRVPRKTAKAKE